MITANQDVTANHPADVLSGGFDDPTLRSAHAFRAIVEALSRPGRILRLAGAQPPAPLSIAAGVALLTLADATTPVHLAGDLDVPALRDWIAFHCGAPICSPAEAVFAVGRWDALCPVERFSVGQPDYPDRSATLIVEMTALSAEGPRLSGPGVRGDVRLAVPDARVLAANAALYPLGFDLLLTCEDRLAGLPRSTVLEMT